MVVGVLQVELYLPDAMNLKDKRRVVCSLKDRLHREYRVAVAEVDRQDAHRLAVLGLATVSNGAVHARQVLDAIVRELRADRRFVLNGHQVEILTGQTDGATGAAQVGRQ